MPNITDLLDELTDFPTAVDSYPNLTNGQEDQHATKAEIINQLEGAVYRTQEYSQNVARVVESASVTGDRRRLTLTFTVTVASSRSFLDYVLTLTDAQMQFLKQTPFRPGNLLLAHARRDDAGGQAYRIIATPQHPDKIQLRLDHIDLETALAAGTYRISVTILGG